MYRVSLTLTLLLWVSGVAQADVTKASSWIDRVVVTSDGELLGRVEDFAIDDADLSVKFVVVAVGSFLIDDNLIAVAPEALEPSDDGEYLVVYTDNVARARRFGASDWPSAADVMPSVNRSQPPTGVNVPADAANQQSAGGGFKDEGVATISDGRRTAVIRSGETSVSVAHDEPENSADAPSRAPAGGEPDPTKLALPDFASLDANDDGRLDRREIGARLGRSESFTALDLDGNGAIDPFEFDVLVESRN